VKTDIPLKLLTALRGADLLPLLGLPAASLVRVETRELPAGATRLDTLLRARSPQGQEYGNYSPGLGSGSGKAGVPISACTAANAIVPRCLAVSITEHNAA